MKVDVQIYREGIKSDNSLMKLKRTVENKCILQAHFSVSCYRALFPVIANNCCARENIRSVPRVVQNKDYALLQAFEK